jgi:hypothetical protein
MSIEQALEATRGAAKDTDIPAPVWERLVPVRPQRHWPLPVAIGAAGLIAAGTLGGFLWSTIGQRDNARHQLVTSQQTLATTRVQLTAAKTDAATRKVTSDYVRLVTAEGGQSIADYGTLSVCNGYGPCRTAAQQTLTDLQAFQTHRAAATVPAELTNADGALRDGLSAAIAAVQELITGADNDDVGKVKDGAKKLDAAVLSIGKAEAAVGAAAS